MRGFPLSAQVDSILVTHLSTIPNDSQIDTINASYALERNISGHLESRYSSEVA
jgi:hypothetical protein